LTVRTPNTFVIGAGPVATALAGSMRLGGVPVLGLWARKAPAARAAGAVAGVASFSAAPPDLLLEADAVVLAVRDAVIHDVATMLVATGLITRRHVLLHCSGAISAREAFGSLSASIGGVGTMHPLRAIADGRTAMRTMRGTVFGVEGDDAGRITAEALVRACGGMPLALDGGQMGAYHAAAAMASNFVVALVDAATTVLSRAGVDADAARTALVALAQGSLTNVGERGVDGGLTGPIRRGDLPTVQRHLDALSAPDSPPELLAMYRVLGEQTLAIARRVGEARPADLDAIAGVLKASPEVPGGEPGGEAGGVSVGENAAVARNAYRA
jgi:predicted short-subunit dehydrogenase-like oxidoreductase (DUF2520 family)